jgi:DNA-binding NarL/FixJ family response regulator
MSGQSPLLESEQVRLLIMDDQPVGRAGLAKLFEPSSWAICGEAASLDELITLISTQRPTLLIGEIRLGDESVIDRLAEIRDGQPGPAVLFYSASDNPVDEALAFAGGANGFLCRTAGREQLMEAAREVVRGESLWTGSDQRRLSNYLRDGRLNLGSFAPLTPREQQILKLLTTGATNRDISDALAISHETVKEHVQHVLKKIGVSDRTQAAVWAVRNGFA